MFLQIIFLFQWCRHFTWLHTAAATHSSHVCFCICCPFSTISHVQTGTGDHCSSKCHFSPPPIHTSRSNQKTWVTAALITRSKFTGHVQSISQAVQNDWATAACNTVQCYTVWTSNTRRRRIGLLSPRPECEEMRGGKRYFQCHICGNNRRASSGCSEKTKKNPCWCPLFFCYRMVVFCVF